MALFIDFHAKLPAIPPELINEMQANVGKPGPIGVIPLAAYFTEDGQGYCVSEAPNADAVCRDHEAHGLTLAQGDVHEVKARIG
jgi:hypothetical protein